MRPNVNGSSVRGASLSTRKASDGEVLDRIRCDVEKMVCRDSQGPFCFFVFSGVFLQLFLDACTFPCLLVVSVCVVSLMF